MESPPALFVYKYSKNALFGEGIVVPTGTLHPRRIPGGVSGWVNGERNQPITWALFPDFVSPPEFLTASEKSRNRACSLIRFKPSGDEDLIRPPCLILPYSNTKLSLIPLKISVVVPSLFETAGFQVSLWLRTVVNVLYNDGLYNAEMERAALLEGHAPRECRPETGDAFLVFCNMTYGVIVLGKEVEPNRFDGELWLPIADQRLLNSSEVTTKVEAEISGVSARFESVFGKLME